MANLPPSPFEFAASDAAANTAAASTSQPLVPDAAATPSDSGAHAVSIPDEPATSLRQEDVAVEYVDLDQECFIGEIFVGARKLNLPPFKLDVEQFMLDIEEPPLFLRQAG